MTERNDPCPCGSGKKYKRCHMLADAAERPALRLLGGAGGDPHGIARSIGGRPISSIWQADLTPLNVTFGNDPAARPAVLMVAAGEFALHADMVSHPPAEPALVAEQLAAAIDAAAEATGRLPAVVEVRYESLARALRKRLAGRDLTVRTSFTLDAVDRAVSSMEQQMGVAQVSISGTRMSRPETWAGWGLEPAQVGRLFGACAAYFRAAPWQHVVNEDVFRAKVTGGGTWSVTVLGNAGEVFGLALYARAADLGTILEHVADDDRRFGDPGNAEAVGALARRMRGATLSLTFGPRDELPRRMRQEVRQAGWELAGQAAWPLLVVVNTPGGGITARQLEDLIAVVNAIPRFTSKHERVLAGESLSAFPLRWRDTASKVALVFESSEQLLRDHTDQGPIDVPPGEEARVVRGFLIQHYREWLDIPVPALGGKTPRQAVRFKVARPVLVKLLEEIDVQAAEALPDGKAAFDATWMWEELGLTRGEMR